MKLVSIILFLTLIHGEESLEHLPIELEKVLKEVPRDIVIAHRGTTYWAPEETEVAMRWARNIGADYLEFDLQRTKDGVLIALHDENLKRTTNVAEVFPERVDAPVSAFTLDELRQLDAGSWFNKANPERARTEFAGQDILTLEDVVNIAEGKRIVRDGEGRRIYRLDVQGRKCTQYEDDPADNGNRPGIYPETKEPHLFPGMERDLAKELERLGWYHVQVKNLKKIEVKPGCVGIANTGGRVILQTFSEESLAKLEQAFVRRIPTCFLLWLGDGISDLKENTPEEYIAKINYGIRHGAVIIGPSIAGKPNDYPDLLAPWQGELIHRAGLSIHPYSFDTEEQMTEYTGRKTKNPALNRTDGMFTNRADMTLQFYRKILTGPDNRLQGKRLYTAEEVLDELIFSSRQQVEENGVKDEMKGLELLD